MPFANQYALTVSYIPFNFTHHIAQHTYFGIFRGSEYRKCDIDHDEEDVWGLPRTQGGVCERR